MIQTLILLHYFIDLKAVQQSLFKGILCFTILLYYTTIGWMLSFEESGLVTGFSSCYGRQMPCGRGYREICPMWNRGCLLAEYVRMRPLLIAVRRVVVPRRCRRTSCHDGRILFPFHCRNRSRSFSVHCIAAPVLVPLFGVIRAVDFLYLGDSLL